MTGPLSRLLHNRWYGVCACGIVLLMLAWTGCDRSSPTEAESPDAAGAPADGDTTAAMPPSAAEPGRTARSAQAVSEPAAAEQVTAEPFELQIGPHVARFPPAELKILGDEGDGLVVLSADSGRPLADGVNALFLQMALELDSGRPWTVGVWRYRLGSGETETTDGLYLGAAENQLRPLEVDVEVVRTLLPGTGRPSRRVEVRLAGRFVPAEAPDPLTAPTFEVSGRFTAVADRP